MRRTLLPATAALLLLVGVSAPGVAPAADAPIRIAAAPREARAETAATGQMRLVLAGSDGANVVELSSDQNGDLLIASPAGVSAPPSPCTLDNPDQARCPAGSISAVRAAFLAGDDSLTVAANVTVPIRASGGNGDDVLSGGAKRDYLRGDGGNDQLSGHGGADDLMGGPGTDSCSGGAGHHDVATGCETVKGVP